MSKMEADIRGGEEKEYMQEGSRALARVRKEVSEHGIRSLIQVNTVRSSTFIDVQVQMGQ
jgi:hypothetical protein